MRVPLVESIQVDRTMVTKTYDELMQMTAKDLRIILEARGISTVGLVEKG